MDALDGTGSDGQWDAARAHYLHEILLVEAHVEARVALERVVGAVAARDAQLVAQALEARLVELRLRHRLLEVVRHEFHVEDALVHDVVAPDLSQRLFKGVSYFTRRTQSNFYHFFRSLLPYLRLCFHLGSSTA